MQAEKTVVTTNCKKSAEAIDKVVGFLAVKLQALQVEAAAEGTLLGIVACFVGDNLGGVADYLSGRIGEV